MRAPTFVLTAAAVVAASACAYNPPPIPVDATPADVERLAGRWQGSYTAETVDRRGAIEFSLAAHEDHAHGDVLMTAASTGKSYQRHQWPDPVKPGEVANAQLLTIRFVRASGGIVSGMLEPYWDPDRKCQASATFLGHLAGEVINGTFTSVCEDGRRLAGPWRVARQRSRP